ncbi:hypothetical protein [Brevibacillus porteri]|uniref:hypothetical protein n=1 Tax=Brevibacillus porteri TaxID=2126350 RepID=UPI00370BDC8C
MSFIKKINSIVLALSLTTVAILTPTAAAYAEERGEVSKLAKKSQQVELTEEEAVTEEEAATEEEALSEEEAEQPELRAVGVIVRILIRGSIMYWKYKKYEEKFESVSESFVKKAVEKVYEADLKPRDYDRWDDVKEDTDLDSTRLASGKYIYLEFGDPDTYGLTHILARHHPKYWTNDGGHNSDDTLSMFDPDTEIKEIETIVHKIVNYSTSKVDNKEEMLKNYNNDDRIAYVGYHKDKEYKLIVSGNKVITLYPYGWNEVE